MSIESSAASAQEELPSAKPFVLQSGDVMREIVLLSEIQVGEPLTYIRCAADSDSIGRCTTAKVTHIEKLANNSQHIELEDGNHCTLISKVPHVQKTRERTRKAWEAWFGLFQ